MRAFVGVTDNDWFRFRAASRTSTRSTSPFLTLEDPNAKVRGSRDLVYRVWRKNAEKQLVAFAFDGRDRLIGLVEHPIATMSPAELAFYVELLARECDRFEYVLRGEDEE
ncbi:MAG: hypothetical protein V1774_08245 [Candidatus Eisenbacteria bacterium]